MLENIKSPEQIKNLSITELNSLAGEIRGKILDTVSKNGGHLASNLGDVELTLALHKVFNCPSDRIIFDVGHQAYTHKLITGRYDEFSTLRKKDGISGFTNPEESIYDSTVAGHSGAALSAALGFATAEKLGKSGNYVIAVIGDGSFTNGMIYEALNNCAEHKDEKLIIVLNDNEMSISKNIGGLSAYLSDVRTSKKYYKLKRNVENTFARFKGGNRVTRFLKSVKDFIKKFFVDETLFDMLGIPYIGPVNGNDLEKLLTVFEEAKQSGKCILVHTVTKKGKGYAPSENEPSKYHSVSPFDKDKGVLPPASTSFSSEAGKYLCDYAARDDKLIAVTAAMCDGTGLSQFAQKYQNRFFDVGIAEEHAITFCTGLSKSGYKPVCILYSTFSQRVYDQLFHDIAIQKVPLTLLLDRAGVVPDDGITHQGIFDYSLFSSIPETEIYSPSDYAELNSALESSLESKKLSIIRYPKGEECILPEEYNCGTFKTIGSPNAKNVIVTYGRSIKTAYEIYLHRKNDTMLIKPEKIFPVNAQDYRPYLANAENIYIIDEGIKNGGFSEKLSCALYNSGIKAKISVFAVEDFLPHASVDELYDLAGISAEQILSKIEKGS